MVTLSSPTCVACRLAAKEEELEKLSENVAVLKKDKTSLEQRLTEMKQKNSVSKQCSAREMPFLGESPLHHICVSGNVLRVAPKHLCAIT